MPDSLNSEPHSRRRRFGCFSVMLMMLAVIVLSVMATTWWIKRAAKAPEPVELSAAEAEVLDDKLNSLLARTSVEVASEPAPDESVTLDAAPVTTISTDGDLAPAPYSEASAVRELSFTERELNALLREKSGFSDQLVVDLARDKVSVAMLVPVDEGMPLLGGSKLKVTAGAGVSMTEAGLALIVDGISVNGIPIPSAWLGGIKGKNLITEYDSADGFWQQFAAGIRHVEVADGELRLELAE